MALTLEQQAQIDFNVAMDASRRNHEVALEQRRARLEAIRLAKETLIENSRSKPVNDRDVNAADITAFASSLNAYIDG